MLPPGKQVVSARLDGRGTDVRTLITARGRVLVTDGGNKSGTTGLVVRLR